MQKIGFNVTAADAYDARKYKLANFQRIDANKRLPFENATFDIVLLAEIIEHIPNTGQFLNEISRVLKVGGKIVLSTPNILNLKSRFRFLFEGNYEYYREPPLDHFKRLQNPYQLHVVAFRYHELEYLLHASGFEVESITTSIKEGFAYAFIKPFIKMQMISKEKRSIKKGGVDHARINKIVLADDILFGRHLILKAIKTKNVD